MATRCTPTPAPAPALSIDEGVRVYGALQRFFEAAVHAVLFYRRLYPERAFSAVTAFGVPTRVCRHPAVAEWVRSAVDEVMRQLCGARPARTRHDDDRLDNDRLDNDRKHEKKAKWVPRRLQQTEPLPPDRVNALAVVVHAPMECDDDADDADDGSDDGDNVQSVTLPPGAVLERWVFDVRHLPRGWPGGIRALRRARADLEKRERKTRNVVAAKARARQTRAPGAIDDEANLSSSDPDADDDYYTAHADPDAMPYEPGTGCVNWPDMEAQMRGVLVRLAQAGQQVRALPPGCTFTVALEMSDPETPSETPRTLDAQLWIPETGRKRKFGGASGGEGSRGGATTAIRTVDCAPLFIECWVEESALKRAVADGRPHQALPLDVLPGEADVDVDVDVDVADVDVNLEDVDVASESDRDDLPDSDSDSPDMYGPDISFGDLVDDSFGLDSDT